MGGQLFNGQGITFLASAARTTSTNTGNLKNTATNIPICDAAAFILDVTALTSTSGATLDVFIDTSPDGGTTWFTAYAFTRVSTSTATRRLDIRDTGIGLTEIGAEGSIATVGSAVYNNTVMTPDVRIRWQPNATTAATATFSVHGIFQVLGTQK